MAIGDDVIRLILDMGQSGKSVDDVRQKLEELGKTVEKTAGSHDKLARSVKTTAESYHVLMGELGTYAVTTDKVDAAMDKLVADAVEQTRHLKAVDLVLKDLNTTAIAAAGERRAGGRGMMGLSYAFQDFTSVLTGGGGVVRALGAITNNIDQLGTSIGLSVANAAKLSLGFTAFTAALPILIPMVQEFWKSMSAGEKGPEPILKAMDLAQQKIEAMRAELEKILAMRPPEEVETRQRVERAFGGRGGEITGGLAGALAATGRGAAMTDAERARLAQWNPEVFRARGDLAGAAWAQQMKDTAAGEIQERLNAANREAAGRIMAAAPTDRGQRDTLREMIRRVPGAFPPRLGVEMAMVEPEVVERTRRQKEQTERILAGNAARVRRQHEADREADELSDKGREFQEAGRKEQEAEAHRDRQRRLGGQQAEAKAQRESIEAQRKMSEGVAAAAALRRETGERLDPEEARKIMQARQQQARSVAERERADIREAGGMEAVQQVQQAQAADFGVVRSLGETARMMKSMQQDREKALNEMVEAMVEANNGVGREVMTMRGVTRFLEGQNNQFRQNARTDGHP